MFQRWLDDLTSYPGAEAVLLGVLALLLGTYLWSATEVRRSQERHMRRIRDSLYISTKLLGQLSIQEQRKYQESEVEHNERLSAMLACKSASCLSPQLQEQIRDCIRDEDTARLAIMHKALERECTALSEELSRNTHSSQWGRSIWRIVRPAAEPAALAATAILIRDLFYGQRIGGVTVDSWDNILPWIRAISLMITIIYGYLLWASSGRGKSGTLTKLLALLIALCSLLHLIGLVAAPYVLALQLILFISGFGLTGTRSRSDRPYAGHTETNEDIQGTRNPPTDEHVDEKLEQNHYTPRR